MSALGSTVSVSSHDAANTFSYCRFCAAQMDRKVLLDLSLDILFGKYIKMLQCLKLDIDLLDNQLPKHACLQCHNKCLEYFNFCLVVGQAQKTLHVLYNNNKSGITKYNIDKNEIKSEIQDDSLNNSDSGIHLDRDETSLRSESNNNTDLQLYSETKINYEMEENAESNLINPKHEVDDDEPCFTDDVMSENIGECNEIEMDDINPIHSSDGNIIETCSRKTRFIIKDKAIYTDGNDLGNLELCGKPNDRSNNLLNAAKAEPSKLQQKPKPKMTVLLLKYNPLCRNDLTVNSESENIVLANTTVLNFSLDKLKSSSNIIQNLVVADEKKELGLKNDNAVFNMSIDNSKSSDIAQNQVDAEKTIELTWKNDNVMNNTTELDISQDKSQSSSDISQNQINVEKTLEFRWKNVTNNDPCSWTNYPWPCDYCREEFDSMEDLREHSTLIHGKCYGFGCADCDGDFNMFSVFVEHVRTHRENLRLFCQYCNKQFENDADCHQHSLTHWASPVCELCGKICPDDNAMYTHRSMKFRRKPLKTSTQRKAPRCVLRESSLTWTDYEWRCLDCFKVEPDIQALRTHFRDVHNKCFAIKCADCLAVTNGYTLFVTHVRHHRRYLQYLCEHCNQHFSDIDDLKAHVNDHVTTENRCYGCGDSFQSRDSLIKHMITFNSTKEKKSLRINLSCDVCLKNFTSYTKLKIHLWTHKVKQRTYVCEVCGKAFSDAYKYKVHSDIHSDKTEKCKICYRRFASKMLLKIHAEHHLTDRPFICDFCGKNFKFKKNLCAHIKCHLNVKPYVCVVCNKKFGLKTGLQTHSLQHTGQRPYSCEVCDKTFTNTGNCNKHMKRKHGLSYHKTKMTDMGKLEIDRESGDLKSVSMDAEAKEWLSTVTRRKTK